MRRSLSFLPFLAIYEGKTQDTKHTYKRSYSAEVLPGVLELAKCEVGGPLAVVGLVELWVMFESFVGISDGKPIILHLDVALCPVTKDRGHRGVCDIQLDRLGIFLNRTAVVVCLVLLIARGLVRHDSIHFITGWNGLVSRVFGVCG